MLRSVKRHAQAQRQAAKEMGIPRTSIQYWLKRLDKLDASPVVKAFFESPEVLAFLHLSQIRYKLFGVVTNLDLPGQELIEWHRERCGKSEEVHSVMKSDLAGGKLPSSDFGENAAWWAIMILALNLNALMRRLVLPKEWATKRLKAIRFGLINVAGRVLEHSRQLFLRLSGGHPFSDLLIHMRGRIMELAQPPT